MAEQRRRFTKPAVLGETHDISLFACGDASLDAWIGARALDNLRLGASRTYVVCPEGSAQVAGYYALAMGAIVSSDVTGSMRRNMPRTIPAVVLGRLAVELRHQGEGLGALLLQDAVVRSLRAAAQVSARILLVHAISPAAEAFYRRHGFVRLPVEAPTLALDLAKLAKLAE